MILLVKHIGYKYKNFLDKEAPEIKISRARRGVHSYDQRPHMTDESQTYKKTHLVRWVSCKKI